MAVPGAAAQEVLRHNKCASILVDAKRILFELDRRHRRAGVEDEANVGQGPVAQSLAAGGYEEAVLLYNYPEAKVAAVLALAEEADEDPVRRAATCR